MGPSKIAVAVSGGLDSLVSACLLKQKGFDLIAVHFLTGFEGPDAPDREALKRLFDPIAVPLAVVDLKEAFTGRVVNYFTQAYRKGKTPNPCLVCNAAIKFDLLAQEALRLGAKRLATGHYARIVQQPDGRWSLRKGVDKSKDQSYFLSRLTQAQLASACFPLGEWTKREVRLFARQRGLVPLVDNESQDICFIQESTYVDFLVNRGWCEPTPGDIVTLSGKRIGGHKGLHRYTVGQRRGLHCPASEPYYVVRLDKPSNRLVVGFRSDLLTDCCRVVDVNWIDRVPEAPIQVDCRIRYRHEAVSSTVSPVGSNQALVLFHKPQTAVTPGQGAVFYQGDRVLGGGWIETAPPAESQASNP